MTEHLTEPIRGLGDIIQKTHYADDGTIMPIGLVTFHIVDRDKDGYPISMTPLAPKDVEVVISPLTGKPNGYRYTP